MMKAIRGIMLFLAAAIGLGLVRGFTQQGSGQVALPAQTPTDVAQPQPNTAALSQAPVVDQPQPEQATHAQVQGATPQPDKYEVMRQMALSMNKQLPRTFDDIRFDATQAGPGVQFFYIYTLLSLSSQDIDPASTARWAKELTTKACGTTDGQRILSLGITEVFLYRGNDGHEAFRVAINSADCTTLSAG